MEFSELTLRILLLFIPGLVSFFIVEQLTVHRQLELHHILLYSFVLGPVDYGAYAMLARSVDWLLGEPLQVRFFTSLIDSKTPVSFEEVLLVSLLGVPIGLFVSFAINRKLIYRIAHTLRVSQKYGDLNVFGYIMNSPATEWIVVRDLDRDLMYQGWVQAFSDSDEEMEELLLRDVIVFKNSTADELFRSPALYLSRPRGSMLIEIEGIPFSDRATGTNGAGDRQ